MTSRGNLQRLMPKEIRILKYVLTINDPEERLGALRDAFTPGEELEGKDVDCLYTYDSYFSKFISYDWFIFNTWSYEHLIFYWKFFLINCTYAEIIS